MTLFNPNVLRPPRRHRWFANTAFVVLGSIAVLGVWVIAVRVFEITLNGTVMFNHANLKLSFNR